MAHRRDPETQTLTAALESLAELSPNAQQRVVGYVADRYGITLTDRAASPSESINSENLRQPSRLLKPLDSKSIGKRIQRLRKQAGVNQSELAQLAGMQQSGLSQVESGVIRPSLELLAVLAHRYKASVDWILFDAGPTYYE